MQNDRITQETTRAKILFKRNSKEQLSIERDLFKREKSVILNGAGDVNQEAMFCTQFVGRCVHSLIVDNLLSIAVFTDLFHDCRRSTPFLPIFTNQIYSSKKFL